MTEEAKEAVTRLHQWIGYPPWLTSIGLGERDGKPLIVIYLKTEYRPKLPMLKGGWEGIPVEFKVIGELRIGGERS